MVTGEEITSEYDADKVEAFVSTSKDPFVRRNNCCASRVNEARKRELEELKKAFGL